MVAGPVGIGFPTGTSGTTTISGCDLLVGFSKFINDYWASETTSAGSGTFNTLVDTSLARFGDDQILDFYVRITEAGSNLEYDVRRISPNSLLLPGLCLLTLRLLRQSAQWQ